MPLTATTIILICLLPTLQAGQIIGKLTIPPASSQKRIAIEKYAGSISGKVSAPPARVAGVWLTAKGLTAPASPPDTTLQQKNYQFGKSLLVVPVGTTVKFPNEDSDYHNIFSLSKAKKFDIGRYKKNTQPVPSVTFDKAGLVKLHCEIHEHMRAHILVVNSPYYTTTDRHGIFRLNNIPPGTYTLHAQLNRNTHWQREITVKPTGVSRIQLSKPSKR